MCYDVVCACVRDYVVVCFVCDLLCGVVWSVLGYGCVCVSLRVNVFVNVVCESLRDDVRIVCSLLRVVLCFCACAL